MGRVLTQGFLLITKKGTLLAPPFLCGLNKIYFLTVVGLLLGVNGSSAFTISMEY